MLEDDYVEMQKSVRLLEERVIENHSQRTIRELPDIGINSCRGSPQGEDFFNELLDERPGYMLQTELTAADM